MPLSLLVSCIYEYMYVVACDAYIFLSNQDVLLLFSYHVFILLVVKLL